MEKIAREKSGVIKKDGRVVLYPEQQPGVRRVIEEACRENRAELHVPDLERIKVVSADIDGTDMEVNELRLHTPFLGEHQINNAAVVAEMTDLLRQRGRVISDEALANGFANAFIPARMEIISRRPLCLLDSGHNPGYAMVLKNALERFVPGRRTAIIGMLADKDSAAALAMVGPEFHKFIAVAPNNPRALAAGELAETARRFCPEVLPAENCTQALELALDGLDEEEALIVCGSFYLAGEIRDMLYDRLAGGK